MKPSLRIASGAAETIGALFVGGEIVRFLFAPARGDEALPRTAETGDIVLGRIKASAPALGGAFVDIGAGKEAFLPANGRENPPAEGALRAFAVRRPALGGKGAVLGLDWKRGLSPPLVDAISNAKGTPGLLMQSFDAAFQIARRAQQFGALEIIADRPEAQRALAEAGVKAACDDSPVVALDIEVALDRSLGPVASLGGARMTFEETAGGCVVDIDAGAAAEAMRAPNDAVNGEAARRLFAELSRRSIGGRVIVDFLPPSSPSQRRALQDLLVTGAAYFERRSGKLAPDGLFDMTAPRRDLSLLERASEAADEGLLRAGRRPTLDWTAKRAIAALEIRLAGHPRLRLALDAGEDVVRYIEDRPRWLARLAERYGARASMSISGRGRSFDVREI